MGLFWLLSLGGIVMAYFNPRLYNFAPPLSLIASGVMLANRGGAPEELALTLVAFTALFAGSGYVLQSRCTDPRLWCSLAAVSSLLFYLIGYFNLHEQLPYLMAAHVWGGLAAIMAGVSVFTVEKLAREIPDGNEHKQFILSIYAALATAFISLCVAIELDKAFLPLAIAGEMAALAWINTRTDIVALRKLTAAMGCVFAYLISWQAIAAFSVIALGSTYDGTDMPMLTQPLVQLGLPSALFLLAAHFLRQKGDDKLSYIFEISAVMLFGAGAHFLSREVLHPGQNVLLMKDTFTERACMTDMMFVYAAFCLWTGKELLRKSFIFCGNFLAALAVFRLGFSDFLIQNPLFDSSQNVGTLFILNSLLLAYGVPVLLLHQIIKLLSDEKRDLWGQVIYGIMLTLAFTLVTLEVRQAFHGTDLASGITSNAEIYAYSFVWLLLGIGLLFMGTILHSKQVRVISLGIMILVVSKVFLYDASELTGLFRVASFLGLGLSLLGLSWFYTRFVVKDEGK